MISGINTRCSVKAPGCSTVTDPDLMAARGWAPTCSYETEIREITHWSATTHCGDIASRIDACLLLGWHGWGCCWCSCYCGGGCYRLLCCTSGNQDRCYDRQQNKKQSWFFHSIITLKGNELSFKKVKIIFAFSLRFGVSPIVQTGMTLLPYTSASPDLIIFIRIGSKVGGPGQRIKNGAEIYRGRREYFNVCNFSEKPL